MSATAQSSNVSTTRDDPWGARARDWAEIEDENSRPLFEAVFDATELRTGTSLLDVGCGSGLACELAAARGARVAGLDASPGMLALARERVPGGDFQLGDMQALPWDDGSFDVVTFHNTFFFATDRETTLREAARVARRGARVAVVAWTTPDEVELMAYIGAVAPLLPPEVPRLDPFITPPAFERLAVAAGLSAERAVELDWSWEYPDLDTALRGLMSAGISTLAIERAGEHGVRDALTAALAPYRLTSGGYRLENTVHCLIARA